MGERDKEKGKEFGEPFHERAVPFIPKGPQIIQDEIENDRDLNR